MVVLEALACGIPVLTSRRVGAAECLPPPYEPWLLAAPEPIRFAEFAVRLLGNEPRPPCPCGCGCACGGATSIRMHMRARPSPLPRLKNAGSSKG